MSPVTILLQFCVVIVLTIAGSGGVPRSCPPDTICLKDYTKEKFHRLTIDCRDLTATIRENSHSSVQNVSYDVVRRCITRRDGILSDCAVTETDDDGKKADLPITYHCTAVFHTLTSENPTPGDLQLTVTTPSSRHPWFFIVAAVGVFLCCLRFLLAWEANQGTDRPSEGAGAYTTISRPWIRSYHWF